MIYRTAALLIAIGLTGCSSTDLLRGPIPNQPPTESPVTKNSFKPAGRSESSEDVASKVNEPRAQAPVMPSQVTDKSARDIARALEAELDHEATTPAPKP